mgnify:CR=1 FL=1
MAEWVEALQELQDKDLRIQKLQAQVDSVPIEKQRAETEIHEADTQLEEAHKAVLHVQSAIRDLENQVESINEKMRDFQTKSTMIKDNAEYRKALAQIDHCKKQIEGFEDRELELMEELEQARATHDKVKKSHDATRKRIEDMQSDLETRAANAGAQLKRTTAERDEIREEVPQQALRMYERIRKSKRGQSGSEILVPMRGETCGHCNMKVTAQTRVNVNKGQMVTCDHCGSLLYAEE